MQMSKAIPDKVELCGELLESPLPWFLHRDIRFRTLSCGPMRVRAGFHVQLQNYNIHLKKNKTWKLRDCLVGWRLPD